MEVPSSSTGDDWSGPRPVTSGSIVTSEPNTTATFEGGLGGFQFIDVSGQETPESRSRNRTIARSHVMKKVRRGQKKRQGQKDATRSLPPSWQDQIVDLLQFTASGVVERRIYPATTDLYNEAFASTMAKNITSSYGSKASRLEGDINPMPLFTKRWTPLVHRMIDHYINVIWPLFWPAGSSESLSPMAIEWWAMCRSSPMLFHASTHAAAAHLDSLRSTNTLTRTTEALAHKTEAIRLINQALSDMQQRGRPPDDVLLMAILSMTSEPGDEGAIAPEESSCPGVTCPFRPPLMPIHWQKQFAKLKSARSHQDALFTLVQMKGGIEGVQSPYVSKAITHHELQAAAMDVRHPRLNFYEAPEIAVLADDPLTNVLMVLVDENRGGGLPGLLEHGMTAEAFKVFVDLQEISVIIEAYTQGTLQNPSVLSITSRRNRTTHALLSLPTMGELAGLTPDQSGLYESCRLAALVYTLAILFPLPPFTGAVRRLIPKVQEVIEATSVNVLFGPKARIFIWALFIPGTAAESMAERPWFVQQLKALLVSEGIVRWAGLKVLLNYFLWMSSAMDEAAMILWEEIVNLQVR